MSVITVVKKGITLARDTLLLQSSRIRRALSDHSHHPFKTSCQSTLYKEGLLLDVSRDIYVYLAIVAERPDLIYS